MRHLLAAVLLVLAAAAPAAAVSLNDLIDLSKQGLSDELLIALVEADESVFHLSPAQVADLKRRGMSDRLLIHLLQTPKLRPRVDAPVQPIVVADRPRRPEPPPPPVERVVIERVEQVHVPVAVPVPVYVAVPVKPEQPKKTEPVYWGFGGKKRPGSWSERPPGGK